MGVMNSESFVFYESVYKQMIILHKRLGAETAQKFVQAVIEFGLYGAVPDEENEVWLYGFEQTITSIYSAQQRREKSIQNGKMGGRPKILLDRSEVEAKYKELKTWKKVAEFFKIDEKTLRNIRQSWEEDQREKGKNGKNLNVNVNVNENENAECVPADCLPAGPATAALPSPVRNFDF